MKLIFTLIALCFSVLLMAQPGTLDKSFGDTGIVLDKNITGILNKIAIQSDGKIIGAGGGTINNITPFLIIRYNTDGSIDSSFGTSGVTGNSNDLSEVFGLAIQQDDAILALGHTASDIKLVKYKKDGRLDSSFGSNGAIITNVGKNDIPVEVLIQPDGKIVAGGYIINQPNEARQSFLIRYLSDGSLDKSFGKKGIIILGEVDGDKSFAIVNDIALQPNGQILMSAIFNVGVVYRFNTDGSLDSSFGMQGKAAFQQSDSMVKSFVAYSLVVQADGKIVGGGTAWNKIYNPTKNYMAAARLNTDGSIDSSFGNNGLQHVIFGKDASHSTNVLLQKDAKIITTGWEHNDGYTHGYFALARFKENGNLDSTFGEDGLQTTSIDDLDYSSSSSLQKDEKIILGGYSNSHLLLARYNNDDKTKKQIIVQKIKHYIQTHNAQATTLNNVSIYPNPAQNILHVQSLSANAKLTVVDFAGNVALTVQPSAFSASYNLNIASLHAGNYLLKIETNGEVVTKQFVKE
jgi:uncharacterized delta-60 repeat protein